MHVHQAGLLTKLVCFFCKWLSKSRCTVQVPHVCAGWRAFAHLPVFLCVHIFALLLLHMASAASYVQNMCKGNCLQLLLY